jgi:hypothetical protein
LRVGEKTRTWEEGKAIIFDDSYEHEVWNYSDCHRIVLVLDVWHPDLSPSKIAAIGYSESPMLTTVFEIAFQWAHTGQIPRQIPSPRECASCRGLICKCAPSQMQRRFILTYEALFCR